MDSPADNDTAEHARPIEIGAVVYDRIFGILLRLVRINQNGAAVWEMMDNHEGDGMNEVIDE